MIGNFSSPTSHFVCVYVIGAPKTLGAPNHHYPTHLQKSRTSHLATDISLTLMGVQYTVIYFCANLNHQVNKKIAKELK